jgi:hypothetical protein
MGIRPRRGAAGQRDAVEVRARPDTPTRSSRDEDGYASQGQAIIEASLDAIKGLVAECQPLPDAADVPFMSLDDADEIWRRVAGRADEWCTLRP